MIYSIPNLDARYTVQKVESWMYADQWQAVFDGKLVGIYGSREWAEHACRFHESQQTCFEEA